MPHQALAILLSAALATNHALLTTFTYDPVGNRISSHLSLSYRYDVANRLLEDDLFTYTYDFNGNLVTKTEKTTGAVTTYRYDIENQLVTLHAPLVTASYRYDGLGRRIEKDVNGTLQRFVYDQEDVVSVYDATGCWQQSFTHGPGIDQPLTVVHDDSGDCSPNDAVGFREQVRPLQADGLGSITSLVSETSGFFRTLLLKERYTYDAFGTPTITGPGPDGIMDTGDDVTLPSSAFGNIYFFAGREFDFESGLSYNRHRYWDPRTGRFIQEDPLRFFGGVNFYTYAGSVGKPLPYFKPITETNPYLYTGNNPVNRIDPLGLWYIDVNVSGGWWGAAGTFGIIFSDKGIYGYGGGGVGTPGLSGGLTWSPLDPTPGWNFGAQGGGLLGIFGGQAGKDIQGNPFWEVGLVSPGFSGTAFYVKGLWGCPNTNETKKK